MEHNKIQELAEDLWCDFADESDGWQTTMNYESFIKAMHKAFIMIELNTEIVELDKWEALIFHDKNEDCYTICWTGKGGAIISNKDKDKAIGTWVEAMNLSDSIRKLMHFKEHGTFPNAL